MTLTYILFIIGFIFLIKGADLLVDGASSLAKKLHIPDIIIGLTIISFGTSLPELIVNILAVLRGSSDIGLGTVIGSNISNIALVLGFTAIVYPLSVRHSTIWREIPYSMVAALILLLISSDSFFNNVLNSSINRVDGIILLIFFVLFVAYTVGVFVRHRRMHLDDETDITHNNAKIALMIIIGLIGLYYGGQWVVNGAVAIAHVFGLSEFVISATIIAIGTSLPELVTSLVAAFKRNLDMAIGNIVGSNIFNILLILGIASIIQPLRVPNLLWLDIVYLIGLSVVLFVFLAIGKKRELERWQGFALVFIYLGYIIFLLARG
ncbi:MAG: calcium/sodium antiporter [Candidatus Komeilibacteria bacterium]